MTTVSVTVNHESYRGLEGISLSLRETQYATTIIVVAIPEDSADSFWNSHTHQTPGWHPVTTTRRNHHD